MQDYANILEKEKRKKFLDDWYIFYERKGYGLHRTAREMGITFNQLRGLVWKYQITLRNKTLAIAKRAEVNKRKRYELINIKNLKVFEGNRQRLKNFWANYKKEHEEYLQLKKRVAELEKEAHDKI